MPAGSQLLTGPPADQCNAVALQCGSSQHVVSKNIGVAVNGDFAIHSIGVLVEVVDAAFNLNPALLGFAVHIVLDAAAIVAAVDTVAGNLVAVAVSLHRGTPADDRVADSAIGTAGVAVGGAGCCHVGHSLGGMGVPAGMGSIVINCARNQLSGIVGEPDLSVNLKILCAESAGSIIHIGDNAAVNFHDQRLVPNNASGPEFLGSLVLVALALGNRGYPGACGQRSNHGLARLGVLTGTGNGDGRNVVVLLNAVVGGEALSQGHALQLPGAGIVQIQSHFHFLDGLNVGGNNIQPVQRADQQAVCIGILGNDLHRGNIGTSLNIDLAGNMGIVAHLVTDGEGHSVNAVSQYGTGDGKLAVAVGKVHCYTVNISLRSGSIQTGSVGLGGIFRNFCFEGQRVVGNSLTGQHCAGFAGIAQNRGFGENRQLAVIHSSGIIDGNVIDIERILAVQVSLGGIVVITAGGGTGAVIDLDVDIVEGLVSHICHIHADIIPALGQVHKLTIVINGGSRTAHTHSDLSVHSFLGDIHPEADCHGIRAVNRGETVNQAVITGLVNLGKVTLHCQSIRTVLNLAGCGIHDADRAQLILAVVPVIAVVIGNLAVGANRAVLAVLVVNSPAGQILILKIVGNDRTLAQIHNGRDRQFTDCSGQRAGDHFHTLIRSGEVETFNRTQSCVGQHESHVVRLQDHILGIIGGRQSHIHGLAVGDSHGRLTENDGIGHYDMNRIAAHNTAVIDHLDGNITDIAVRGEQAVLINGAEGSILQLPGHVSRDLSGSADQVRASCSELHSAAGGVVVLFGLNVRTNKFTGGRSGRDHQNTMGGLTLGTVRGRAVDLQLLAGALGQEGRGTAAVAVHSIDAAQREHEFAHLIIAHAGGVGRLTAVVHNHNDRAVRLNTHKGTGCAVSVVLGSGHIRAILDQEAKVGRDNLLFPTGDGRAGGADLNLGHAGGSCLAVLLVKIDDKAGLGAGSLALAVHVHLAVQNHVAQRLTDQLGMLLIVSTVIPAQAQVHRAYNIEAPVLFHPCGLLGHDLHAVITGGGIHLLIAGNNGNILIADISRHDMQHLAAGAFIIVQNNLRLRDTGRNVIITLADQVVVVTGRQGQIKVHTGTGGAVGNGSILHYLFSRHDLYLRCFSRFGCLSGSLSSCFRCFGSYFRAFLGCFCRFLRCCGGFFGHLIRCFGNLCGGFRIHFRCECIGGHHTHKHKRNQQQRQNPCLKRLLHWFTSSSEFKNIYQPING